MEIDGDVMLSGAAAAARPVTLNWGKAPVCKSSFPFRGVNLLQCLINRLGYALFNIEAVRGTAAGLALQSTYGYLA
jgi:hypothetical protein